MPAFAFDKILRIVQTVLTILQFAVSAFTGEKAGDSDESEE